MQNLISIVVISKVVIVVSVFYCPYLILDQLLGGLFAQLPALITGMSSFDHGYRGLGQAANLVDAFGVDAVVNLPTRKARKESEANEHHHRKRQQLAADSNLEHYLVPIEDIKL